MKKIIKQIFIFSLCIMACGLTGNATATDKETKLTTINAPFVTISDISLDKQTVKKNQKLQYQFTLSFVDTFDYYNENLNEGAFMDDNTSMYYAVVYWQSPKQQNIVRVYEWPATKQTITIKDSILVKKGMQSGQWEISKIFIQNRSPESEDEGTTLAVKNGTEKEQLEKGDIDTYYTDLSVFDFTVTDVSKKADDKAPTIVKKSLKVSKTKIKKNKKSTFSVQVKDASGIESVTCIWGLKGKHDEYDSYKKMKYNKKTKKYECKIKLTKNYKRARLLCIITKDIYGNEAYYSLENPTYKKKYKKAFSNVTVYRK